MTSTKNQVFDPPPPVHMGRTPSPLWTSTRGRHEIHTALEMASTRGLGKGGWGLKPPIGSQEKNFFSDILNKIGYSVKNVKNE